MGVDEKMLQATEQENARCEVAKELRRVRKQAGMTQEKLAELVGTKKSNISRLESGRYNPSLDFLVKVANGLGREVQITINVPCRVPGKEEMK